MDISKGSVGDACFGVDRFWFLVDVPFLQSRVHPLYCHRPGDSDQTDHFLVEPAGNPSDYGNGSGVYLIGGIVNRVLGFIIPVDLQPGKHNIGGSAGLLPKFSHMGS